MGYLDPGLFGTVAQFGSLIAFTLVTVLLFLTKPIRNLFARLSKKPGAANDAIDATTAGNVGEEHEGESEQVADNPDK
jgi:hypothetical protein